MSYYGACKGTTKAGKPCGAVDLFENGRCKHHGGEGQLIRVKLLIAKTLKKVDRLKKKGNRFDRMVAQAAKRDPQLAAMLAKSKEHREAKKVAGYEFRGGSAIGTEQHKATEKLDDIHALSVELGKRS